MHKLSDERQDWCNIFIMGSRTRTIVDRYRIHISSMLTLELFNLLHNSCTIDMYIYNNIKVVPINIKAIYTNYDIERFRANRCNAIECTALPFIMRHIERMHHMFHRYMVLTGSQQIIKNS